LQRILKNIYNKTLFVNIVKIMATNYMSQIINTYPQINKNHEDNVHKIIFRRGERKQWQDGENNVLKILPLFCKRRQTKKYHFYWRIVVGGRGPR